jgi:hypothetical protein
MPGFLLNQGATVLCAHGGQARPTAPNPRVKVDGQTTATLAAPYAVTGCPFNVSGAPSPCVTAQWMVAATRVRSGGQPVLLQDSKATCAPNGTPVNIVVTQVRVKGK